MDKFFEKPQKIFVIFALFWGLVFALLNPPFQAPDEPEHLFKMWGITQGSLNFKKLTLQTSEQKKILTGQILPKGLIEAGQKTYHLHFNPSKKTSLNETKEIINIKLEKENQIFFQHPVPAYTPLSYLPTLFFIWVLSWFNTTPFLMLITARICSLITYVFLTYYAINITPIKKWLFLVFALMPMCIYEASACSTDALTNGISLLFIAYTLNLAYNKKIKKIGHKENIIFFSLIAILSICKFAYFPMILLYLIIPKTKFKRQIIKFLLLLIFAFILIIVLFNILNITLSKLTGCVSYLTQFGLDSEQLIRFAVTHPFVYLVILIKTLTINFMYYLSGFIGMFGWVDTIMPIYATLVYLIILILNSFMNFNEAIFKFTIKDNLLFIIIVILCTILVLSGCFVIYSIDALNLIAGVQGRYFIPYMLLLFLLFANVQYTVKNKFIAYLSVVLINVILFISLIEIICRFYI